MLTFQTVTDFAAMSIAQYMEAANDPQRTDYARNLYEQKAVAVRNFWADLMLTHGLPEQCDAEAAARQEHLFLSASQCLLELIDGERQKRLERAAAVAPRPQHLTNAR
ncbi:hypothetical protein PQR68_34440 [Paraburkholderia agricolaris]|uniref:hypothetical protein n=1 Tax=Paraburkholderia agricolaris TaxID=2152888 RepID=UPI0038BAA2AE